MCILVFQGIRVLQTADARMLDSAGLTSPEAIAAWTALPILRESCAKLCILVFQGRPDWLRLSGHLVERLPCSESGSSSESKLDPHQTWEVLQKILLSGQA